MLDILTVLLILPPCAIVIFNVASTIHDAPTDPFPTPEAEEKSRCLFLNSLSPEQLKEYNDKRRFTVVGGMTQRRYVIHCGSTTFNVSSLNDDGRIKDQICFVPHNSIYLPRYDIYLAQKLSLEADEVPTFNKAHKMRQDYVTHVYAPMYGRMPY